MSVFQEKAMVVAGKIHFRIFGHEMGEEMQKFLGNLSWSFFGGVISAGLFFVFIILSGRWLGPEEFGKFSLALSGSYFFSLLILFGFDTASIRWLSRKEVDLGGLYRFWKKILFISISINGCLLYLLLPSAAAFLKVDVSILVVGSFVGFFFAIRSTADIILRGLQDFKLQSKLKLLESSIVLVLVLIYPIFFRQDYFFAYLIILSVGYFFYSFFVFKNIMVVRNKDVNNVDCSVRIFNKSFYQYSIFAFIGGLSGILMSYSDKFFLNHFLPPADLGVYSAYYMSSVLLVNQLALLATNVLFPAASILDDISAAFRKLNKFFFLMAPSILSAVILFVIFALFLFGGGYPIILETVVFFSIYSVLLFYFSMIWWLIASQGVNGIRFTSINGVISGFLMVLGFYLISDSLSIDTSVFLIMMPVIYNICIANFVYARKRSS